MDDMWVIGVVTATLVPIIIGVVTIIMQWKKDEKEVRKEQIDATSKLTEAMTKLTNKIETLFNDNAKQDEILKDHEERISDLEHTVTVVENDVHHYHKEKG